MSLQYYRATDFDTIAKYGIAVQLHNAPLIDCTNEVDYSMKRTLYNQRNRNCPECCSYTAFSRFLREKLGKFLIFSIVLLHVLHIASSPNPVQTSTSHRPVEAKLQGKLFCGTTDQGSNIKAAMQRLSGDIGELNWLPCATHTIQHCVNAAGAAVPQAYHATV